MHALVHTQLGDYYIHEELGRGGMAIVYRATHPQWGEVALKVLPPYFAHQPGTLKRFMREAQAIGRLRHPHIISIHEAGDVADPESTQQRIHYIAMEYVAGGNLHQRLQHSAPLSQTDVIALGTAIGSALDYAHSQGIIHRDVKPSNILFRTSGEAVLTDFGIAYAADTSKLTRTGAFAGTIAYLAPEVAQGLTVSPRSDVYSLSLVLYECLTAVNPYSDEDSHPMAMLQRVVAQPLEPIHKLNAHVSRGIAHVIEQACAKQAAQRPATAALFVQQLQAAPQGTAAMLTPLETTAGLRRIELTPAPVNKPTISKQRRTLPWADLLKLAGGVVVLGLFLSWLFTTTNKETAVATETLRSTLEPLPIRGVVELNDGSMATMTLPPSQELLFNQTATPYVATQTSIALANQAEATRIAQQSAPAAAPPGASNAPPATAPPAAQPQPAAAAAPPAAQPQPAAAPAPAPATARPQPAAAPPTSTPAQPTAVPDRDGDGVPDNQDACPDQSGPVNGCLPTATPAPQIADRDGDGVPDGQDFCPDTPQGGQGRGGCPDSDGDGNVDKDDACPNEPGTPDRAGCPAPPPPPADSDGDGIPDNQDACPSEPGSANGCVPPPPADSDDDGIPDDQDACPNEPGSPRHNGCPQPIAYPPAPRMSTTNHVSAVRKEQQ